MKTFFATALLTASAFAAEQGIFPTEPEEPVAESDDMWTNDEIKDHVSEHFGAVEWDSFTE